MSRDMLPEDSRKSTLILGVPVPKFRGGQPLWKLKKNSPRELFHDAALACSSQRYPGTNPSRLMQLRLRALDFGFSFR